MLAPRTLFFLWALLGVAGAQNEGATSSVKGQPTAQLQYRESRHYVSYGAAKQLENPVENTPSKTTHENTSAPMSHGTNAAVPSTVTRSATGTRHRRKTLGTQVQEDRKTSTLARTVQETKGISPPEASLEDSGTSVVCRSLTTGNLCIRNTPQGIVRGSPIKVDRQETGSAQRQQNRTHPRWVPIRPGHWHKPFPRPPFRPEPQLRPKPKPKPRPELSYSYLGGSNYYIHDTNPSDYNNGGVSTHWAASFPILIPGLALLQVVHYAP